MKSVIARPKIDKANYLPSLERDEDSYIEPLLGDAAAHLLAGREWSYSPLYSAILNSWNFRSPPDQMGFYVVTWTGVVTVSEALSKCWFITKSAKWL